MVKLENKRNYEGGPERSREDMERGKARREETGVLPKAFCPFPVPNFRDCRLLWSLL